MKRRFARWMTKVQRTTAMDSEDGIILERTIRQIRQQAKELAAKKAIARATEQVAALLAEPLPFTRPEVPMTETEWCGSNPDKMLAFLRGRCSPRKLRLFACACSRLCIAADSYSSKSDIERLSFLVDVAERLADGVAGPEELRKAIFLSLPPLPPGAYCALPGDEWMCVSGAIHEDAFEAADVWPILGRRAVSLEIQASILRDIVGNPVNPPQSVTEFLGWHRGTVVDIARMIFAENSYHDLPILADALEEAGCTDANILTHCRGTGDHCRGCWVLDLLLQQE